MKNYITIIIVALVASVVGGFVYAKIESPVTVNYGDTSHLSGSLYVAQGVVEGGINSTTTTATAETLAVTDISNIDLLSITPTVGALTITLPASTTLNALGLLNAGDYSQFVVHDASTTAGITLTVAGGTGSLLQDASTTKAIQPGGTATFDVVRKANTDYVFIMNPAI